MPQPKAHLLQILINLSPASHSITEIYDGIVLTQAGRDLPLSVNVGDRVAWLVQVNVNGARKPLPYTVTFNTSSFFGVPSLSVPKGGASDFLHVLPFQGKVKYTLEVPGLVTIDPDIQSGNDMTGLGGGHHGLMMTGVSYTVYWDTSQPNNEMTYSGSHQPILSLRVHPGDKITFIATDSHGNPVSAPSNFSILFQQNSLIWPSPFSSSNPCLPPCPSGSDNCPPCGGVNAASLGPFTVGDQWDPSGSQFPFVASITLSANPPTTSNNPNNYFQLA
jgi:hypothetical protein